MRASVIWAGSTSPASSSMSAIPSPTSFGAGAVTNAPPLAPTRTSIRPFASSMRSASRTETRLTPSCFVRSRSDGSWSPGASEPARIAALIRSTISAETRPVLTGVKSAALMG
jgi:hypothetical protein